VLDDIFRVRDHRLRAWDEIQSVLEMTAKSFSNADVFWVSSEFSESDHFDSTQRPRYITSSFNSLRVVDTWGNTYWLRRPTRPRTWAQLADASLP